MENYLKEARIAKWARRAAGFVRGRSPEPDRFPASPDTDEGDGAEGIGVGQQARPFEGNFGLPAEADVEPTSAEQTLSDDELARSEAGVDARWYLQTYPDVAANGMDPVAHYLDFGWLEGRDPRPDFSTADYLALYDELAKAQQNPLIHFLRNRAANGEPDPEGPSQWHALWTKGLFYPKTGDPPPAPTGRFGAVASRKILFVGHEATRTGAPLILLALMKEFQRLPGTEVFLLLGDGGALLEDYNRVAHVLVNRNGALYRVLTGRLLRSLAAPTPTLAICNSASSWQIIRELRRAGISNIVTLIHERVTHYSQEACRALQLDGDRIVFPARAVKAAAVQAYPEFRHALVASQGLLDSAFGQADRQAARRGVRERLGLAPETKIVFSCGVREPRKGFDLFLQLAARVIPQTRLPVHFVWLGGDERVNEFTRFFYHDLALLGLRARVSVIPNTADPESYFLAADAYALTSRDDPFPCVMLEAMACALPVVAFAGAGGAGEALSDHCGIMVPYLDVEAMARHVCAILEQPADFAAMSAKAERRVRSAYRFTDYAQQILNICAELEPSRIAGTPVVGRADAALAFSPRPPMTDISAIRRAVEAGVAFLESAQLPSGEIPIEISPTAEMSGDCVREPVVFVAALAARALWLTPSAARVRSRAFDFLLREMHPDGLWRHPSSDKPLHDATPLDVDDTAIASAALAAAGREIPDNRRFLVANREDNGLFRTWIVRWRPHPLLTRRFFRHTAKVRDVDAVVNANVVTYLGICEETRPAIEHMLEVLRANGEMTSTIWYGSPFTVWYFFSLALREIAPEAGEIIVPRIETAAPVNALELALATSTLLAWNQTPDVGPLLDAQLPSGAWPRAGFYHMGQRQMDSQPKPPWWGSEALTTVFAVEALSRRLLIETR